jgi:prevent-host-death family protein
MVSIGIRAIRQDASAYLRRVEAGETIEITDRGRPVALWVPVRRRKGIARLENEGRLSATEGDLLDLGAPLPKQARAPAPSSALAKQRQDER